MTGSSGTIGAGNPYQSGPICRQRAAVTLHLPRRPGWQCAGAPDKRAWSTRGRRPGELLGFRGRWRGRDEKNRGPADAMVLYFGQSGYLQIKAEGGAEPWGRWCSVQNTPSLPPSPFSKTGSETFVTVGTSSRNQASAGCRNTPDRLQTWFAGARSPRQSLRRPSSLGFSGTTSEARASNALVWLGNLV